MWRTDESAIEHGVRLRLRSSDAGLKAHRYEGNATNYSATCNSTAEPASTFAPGAGFWLAMIPWLASSPVAKVSLPRRRPAEDSLVSASPSEMPCKSGITYAGVGAPSETSKSTCELDASGAP